MDVVEKNVASICRAEELRKGEAIPVTGCGGL
jgi:hypothetical protein